MSKVFYHIKLIHKQQSFKIITVHCRKVTLLNSIYLLNIYPSMFIHMLLCVYTHVHLFMLI